MKKKERLKLKKIYIKKLEKNNSLINKYKQEIKELKEKLNNKDDTSKIKSDDNMPYLETEEEAVERIADFHAKKGKGYVDLPIILSKLDINSSKELISNIEQLINDLYDNEKITKQVYNNLIKAITYKNDS